MSDTEVKQEVKNILSEIVFEFHERRFTGDWQVTDLEVNSIFNATTHYKTTPVGVLENYFMLDSNRYELISSWYSCLDSSACFSLESDAIAYLRVNGYPYNSYAEAVDDNEADDYYQVISYYKKEWVDTNGAVDFDMMLKMLLSDVCQHWNDYGYCLASDWLPTDQQVVSLVNDYRKQKSFNSWLEFANNSKVVDEIVLLSKTP